MNESTGNLPPNNAFLKELVDKVAREKATKKVGDPTWLQEETEVRAKEVLEKLQSFADDNPSLNLDMLNDILYRGRFLAKKKCFPAGVGPDANQKKAVVKVLGEIEGAVDEVTMDVSLIKKLKILTKELIMTGNEILSKIPEGIQNSEDIFIDLDKERPNALYILKQLKTMQIGSFRSLGDVNFITLRAAVLTDDKSYPKNSSVGSENLYHPTSGQKDTIRRVVKDISQLASDSREKASQKIVGDAGLQVQLKEKLASLIRIGQEIMGSTKTQAKESVKATTA